MKELNRLFDLFLNIKVEPCNKNVDVFELNASPEEVINLLVYLFDGSNVRISDFYGDFPITYNYLEGCINEARDHNR